MAFKIGDIVMRMDGDKRPHKIVDITVHYPLNRNEHTFFQYHYEDGGSDVSDWSYLRLYDGKYKRNKVMKANEAPEKYPMQFRDKIDEYLWKEHHILGGCCSSIESMKYAIAREVAEKLTDAFIEKASTWIANRYQANGSYLNADDIEDFEKYMKGE